MHEETVRREEKVYYFSKEKHSSWGYDNVMSMDTLLSKAKVLLPEDKLTITCGFGEVNIVNMSHQSEILHCKVIEGNLTEDLGNFFDNEKCSDITLSVDEHEIKVHRAILTARSNVFAGMFENEMEERKLNRVIISDVDHEVLKEFLKFMYTGKAPNLDKMADGLLAAADKYALESLKAMCEKVLCSKHSLNAAAEILMLADFHNADQLKAKIIAFIKDLVNGVMQTEVWQSMITTHSQLVAEVLRAFAKK